MDALVESNKGKVRVISKAGDKKYGKGRKSGSIYRAERANTAHEMTTKEARSTEVKTRSTRCGKYANAHTIYDMKDDMIDIAVEVEPTEAQRQGEETSGQTKQEHSDSCTTSDGRKRTRN
jgi:hypothetical protein